MFSHQIHFTPITLDVHQLLSVVHGNCSPQSGPVAVTAPDGITTVDGSYSSPSPKNNCTSSAFVTGSNYTQDDAGVPSQPEQTRVHEKWSVVTHLSLFSLSTCTAARPFKGLSFQLSVVHQTQISSLQLCHVQSGWAEPSAACVVQFVLLMSVTQLWGAVCNPSASYRECLHPGLHSHFTGTVEVLQLYLCVFLFDCSCLNFSAIFKHRVVILVPCK